MTTHEKPSPILSTLVVALVILVWILLRLVIFRNTVLPLTFIVPILICVWSRRRWHLWTMAALFVAITIVEFFWAFPPGAIMEREKRFFLLVTLFNVVVGAIVAQVLLVLRDNVDRRSALLEAKNDELERLMAELSRQNEEIKAQGEELAQQNEEIESQSAELGRQNEELHEANERLRHREEVLSAFLESSRTPESGREALEAVCRRALHIIGGPVAGTAILKIDSGGLRLKVQALADGLAPLPEHWTREGSIAGVVLEQDKTAYLYDLAKQPELAAPFGAQDGVRSILATPVRIGGAPYGVFVACSQLAGHWTQEQFRVLEWLAAQCGPIAEALRWQRALAERARDIEEANRAKDRFLANLSHELRTPLTPVLAAAGMLERDERIPADAREDLQMIRRNVAIQSRLIDDLLDLTRVGRGKLELVVQWLDLGKLLKETATIVAQDFASKQQTLVLDVDAAEGGRILGDGPRLQQVFWNLLKNAMKFSAVGGRIEMKAKRMAGPEPRIAIEISDNGVGIAPENLERIFRPFEQVTTGGRQNGSGGLGLGLSIAKSIIELHKGSISVASKGTGLGATFTVELALASARATEAPTAAAPRTEESATGPNEKPLRILLVEDHGDTNRVLARLLRNAGHAVEQAGSAAAALELFQGNEFDLLISDLGLPDESGIALMRRLRALRPDLAALCISGYGMEDDRKASLAAGFVEHLTKPVDMPRLHAAINRARHRAPA